MTHAQPGVALHTKFGRLMRAQSAVQHSRPCVGRCRESRSPRGQQLQYDCVTAQRRCHDVLTGKEHGKPAIENKVMSNLQRIITCYSDGIATSLVFQSRHNVKLDLTKTQLRYMLDGRLGGYDLLSVTTCYSVMGVHGCLPDSLPPPASLVPFGESASSKTCELWSWMSVKRMR